MDTKYYNIIEKATIPTDQPKSIYRIHLKFMYGDADHYDNEHYDFTSPDEFDMYYRIYAPLLQKRPYDDVDVVKLMKPILDEYLDLDTFIIEDYKEYGAEDCISNWMGDSWPYDMHGDCKCALWGLSVTYFDESGVEHEVDVKEKK